MGWFRKHFIQLVSELQNSHGHGILLIPGEHFICLDNSERFKCTPPVKRSQIYGMMSHIHGVLLGYFIEIFGVACGPEYEEPYQRY